jgi:hypothetical protein
MKISARSLKGFWVETKGKTMKNVIAKVLTLAGLAAGFAALASADTIWYVDGSFDYDGLTNSVSGTFALDPTLALLTYDVTVDGSNLVADNEYTPGNSIAIHPDQTHLDFYDGSTNQYLDLYFASPLSNAGGTISLLAGDDGADSSSTIACPGCSVLVSGTVSTTAPSPAPEPASIGLASGVGVLGLAAWRRKKTFAR